MDLEKCKTLLTVIESGSLSHAADRLKYTPSGISRMMTSLEEEFGFSLLIRGKKGIAPSKECLELLPSIREFVFAGEHLSQTAAEICGGESGTIVIGTAYSYFYQWITKVTSLFHKEHPGVQFRILNGTSTELIEKLTNHQLDFCLISEREGNHNWIPLCHDYLVAMLPANHPMADFSAIPVEIFATEPYIETYPGQDIDNSRIFAKCNIIPNTQFSTLDIYATYSMVEAGLGISMNNHINSYLWNGTVKHLPLEPNQSMDIGLAHEKNIAPAAKKFLEFLKNKNFYGDFSDFLL